MDGVLSCNFSLLRHERAVLHEHVPKKSVHASLHGHLGALCQCACFRDRIVVEHALHGADNVAGLKRDVWLVENVFADVVDCTAHFHELTLVGIIGGNFVRLIVGIKLRRRDDDRFFRRRGIGLIRS